MPLRGEVRSTDTGYEFYDPDTNTWGARNPGGVQKTVVGKTTIPSSSTSDSSQSTGTSTTSTEYTKPLPDTPAARDFKAPEYDEREVAKMTQQQAAPGIRSLRTTVQQAMNTQSDINPNVKRMTLRDALAGYGQGLESVMAGASSRATNIYGQRHATDIMETQTNFSAQQRRDELDFQKLMTEYQGSKVTTAKTEKSTSGSDSNMDALMDAFKAEYAELTRRNAGPAALYQLSQKYGYM